MGCVLCVEQVTPVAGRDLRGCLKSNNGVNFFRRCLCMTCNAGLHALCADKACLAQDIDHLGAKDPGESPSSAMHGKMYEIHISQDISQLRLA